MMYSINLSTDCASPIFPGVVARTSSSYDWIEKTVCIESKDIRNFQCALEPLLSQLEQERRLHSAATKESIGLHYLTLILIPFWARLLT